MSDFQRLAFVVACSAYVAGVWALGEWLSIGLAVAAALGGIILAPLLTVEQVPDPGAEADAILAEGRADGDGMRVVERGEIGRRARLASVDDEDA